MTEQDEEKRKLLQSRTASVTIERLKLLSSIDDCSVGQLIDQMVEEKYNSYVAAGRLRDYLKALQSLGSDTVQ